MKQIEMNLETEYASESISEIPAGYIDKSICACGMTTVALENDKNVVLAVPTIYLALNKADQYPNERCSKTVLPVWGDTSTTKIEDYLRTSPLKKIICTYDSLPKVEFLLPDCQLVVDESNMLLSLAKQRPHTIQQLFEIAYKVKETVSFVSATPAPIEYMPEWTWDLDQVKITWPGTIKASPIICERTYPFKSLCHEFLIPLKNMDSMTVEGKTFSKAIIFLNSISQINKVIKDAGLDKNSCGIICGDSLKNDVSISGIERYRTGPLPKFLFLTSSGFCGIDLDDEDAMTIIVSNTSKDWQMIDMLTDLKQAVSRQRNKNNPNYGSYIYIYNQTLFSQGETALLQKIEKVREKIILNIPHYDHLKSIGQESAFMCDNDFKAYTIFREGKYVMNDHAFNYDRYFILETRRQYTSGFDIKGCIGSGIDVKPVSLPRTVTYMDLVKYFEKHHVNGNIDWGHYSTRYEWIQIIEDSYRLYKKVWKDFSYATEMVKNYLNLYERIRVEVKGSFAVGSSYTRSQIKNCLGEIYGKHEIKRTPSHLDLNDMFITKEKKIKGERMVEIIGKLK